MVSEWIKDQGFRGSTMMFDLSKSLSQLSLAIYGEKMDFLKSMSTLKWFENAKKIEKIPIFPCFLLGGSHLFSKIDPKKQKKKYPCLVHTLIL